MRILLIALFLLISPILTQSQSFLSPAKIDDVSKLIDLAPGLSIEEVFTVANDFKLRFEDWESPLTYFQFGSGFSQIAIPPYSYIKYESGKNLRFGLTETVVYSFDFYKGFTPLIRPKKNEDSSPMSVGISVYSFNARKMVIRVDGYPGNEPEFLVIISGDWNRYMTLNHEFNPDINLDSKVNALDLLLLQNQWKQGK